MKDNIFLVSLFEALNKANIQYAVLRNYKSLPYSCGGSDLDLWVSSKYVNEVVDILFRVGDITNCALVSKIDDKYSPKYCFQGINYGVQIDLFKGVIPCLGGVLFYEEEILNHITNYNNISIIDDKFASIIAFLKEVINNGRVDNKYLKPILYSDIYTKKYLSETLNKFPNEFIEILSDSIQNKSLSNNILILQKLSYNVVKKQSIISKFRKLVRLRKQPGYTIAFLGTDGSGKTTIIEAITPILNEAFHNGIRYEHMRPNFFNSLAVVSGKKKIQADKTICDNPHGSRPSGFIGSICRISYYMLDYTFGYFKKIYLDKAVHAHIWFFDRYFYDYVNDPLRARISLPKWLLNFYSLFVPSPDLVICLGTDATKIHRRKPELSFEEVIRQVKQLQKFANENDNAVWIDTGCSIEESINATMNAIISMMSNRFKSTSL